jgi:hypothetical protein
MSRNTQRSWNRSLRPLLTSPLLAGFAGLALGSIPAHSFAEELTVNIRWNCAQTVPNASASPGPLPTEALIPIRVTYPTGDPSGIPTVNLEGFRTFLAPLETTPAASRVDYSSCLASLASRTGFPIFQACKDRTDVPDCVKRGTDAFLSVRREIGLEAEAAAAAGGRAPLPPLRDLNLVRPALSAEEMAFEANPDRVRENYQDMCNFGSTTARTSRSFIETGLPALIRERREAGKNACADSMILSLLDTVAEQLPSTRECRRSSTPECEEAARTATELSRLLTPLLPEGAQRALPALNACFSPNGDPGAGIRFLAEEVRHANACIRPSVGGPGIVPGADAAASPVAPPRYRLSQPTEGNFVAEVYAPFSPPEKAAQMRAHANQCLEQLNPRLQGPGSQSLNIRLVEEVGSPPIPPNPIAVVSADARSNSLAWEEDITCDVVVHELLHVLGLIDEYQETAIGYHETNGHLSPAAANNLLPISVPSYNCRSVGPGNSIMHYTNWAVGTPGALLRPAHFRAITQPGCASANRLYYACAQDAYETSIGNLGNGCARNLPPECRNGEAWLQ